MALPGRLRAAAPDDAFAALDATAQAELVRRGEVKPAELLEAAIARIDALNPALNAIVTPLLERARHAAGQALPAGPFSGVPYALKDLIDLQGTRRTSGSRLLAGHISAETGDIAARSMASGLVVLGKTNTPEFALNASTEPRLFGPSRNPWAPLRSAGGSSGGAAVAVASGMLAIAHASDGGGSIRIPASCCGLFGLKPSRGRMTGSRQTDAGVDHCLSRSVRDSARLFQWNQRQDAAAPLPPITLDPVSPTRRLRIGFSTQGIFGLEPAPAVKAALEQTARLCASLGHQLEPARLPIEGDEFFRHFMVAWSGGAARAVQMAKAEGCDPETMLEPWTLFLAAHARAQAADAGPLAAAYFTEVARRFDRFFSDYDVMLTPVVDDEPPALGYLGPDVAGPQMWDRLVKYVAYTPVHNVAGTPAMSVPLGMSPSGLPIGSQFAARIGGEKTLFDLAFALEQVSPWAQRRPPAR
ncbi:MAG: amidase [Rhizobiales bacterium]|nr:amidase [Hyphomicrobiales bacterium]